MGNNNLSRFKKSKTGQVTILGLIMVTIMIVVFSALYPLLQETIETVTNNSHLSSTTKIILDFLIPAIAISILITIFIFVSPQRE